MQYRAHPMWRDRARKLAGRNGVMLVIAALLVATAVAFVTTQREKLTRSPITDTEVSRTVAPGCECAGAVATIAFRLRQEDALTVSILDERGEPVRTLARNEQFPPGEARFEWDGRSGRGEVVPDGSYNPSVRLDGEDRTFVFPNVIVVDATAPVATILEVAPAAIAFGSDEGPSSVTVTYRLSERARPVLTVDGRQAVVRRSRKVAGKLEWSGRVGGVPVEPGEHELRLVARDLAGNLGEPSAAVTLLVR
jgi:hypothetical protein